MGGSGHLKIADSGNHRIRMIDLNGIISTFAGTGRSRFRGDQGPPTQARLSRPSAVAADIFGDAYIADEANRRIRKVSDGAITTLAWT